MAGKDTHLIDRDGRYFARIVIPLALRGALGKTELREPLGSDKRVARHNLHAAVARMKATIEAASIGVVPAVQQNRPARRPTTLRDIALANYRDQLAVDDTLRQTGNPILAGSIDEGLVADLRSIAKGLGSNDVIRAHLGESLAIREAAGIIATSPQWRDEARQLAGVELEALQRLAERDDGDFGGRPTHALLTKTAPSPVDPLASRITSEDSTKTLGEMLPRFLAERRASSAMKHEHHVSARMFAEFMGEDVPAYRITKRDVIRYKDALLSAPANATKRFPGKTLPEAIEANGERATPFGTLQPKTVNDKWLSRLHALLAWCDRRGDLPDNPASGVRVEFTSATKPPRDYFRADDLARIFARPMFNATAPVDETHWAMLISLFAGTRPSELAQIELSAIRSVRGVLAFHIENETKNAGSHRTVPVHPTLLALGLDQRISALRKCGATHLFPVWFQQGQDAKRKAEARAESDSGHATLNQHYPKYLPKRVNVTYLPKVGVKAPGKDFYSFRHTFKTGLSFAGVEREIRDYLCGHRENNAGSVYEHEISIERMNAAVASLRYDGLDLSKLILTLEGKVL